MALFHMQRFMREEGSVNDRGCANDILMKLHEKARLREKLTGDPSVKSSQETAKRKPEKPSRALQNPPDATETKVVADGQRKKKKTTITTKKEKKKKKKKTKTKKKRTAETSERILKKLHAKARWRERALLDGAKQDGDVEDGDPDPAGRSEREKEAEKASSLELPATSSRPRGEKGRTGVGEVDPRSSEGVAGKRKRRDDTLSTPSAMKKSRKSVGDAPGDVGDGPVFLPSDNPRELVAPGVSGKASKATGARAEDRESIGSPDHDRSPMSLSSTRLEMAKTSKKKKKPSQSPLKKAEETSADDQPSPKSKTPKTTKKKKKQKTNSREARTRTTDDSTSSDKAASPSSRTPKRKTEASQGSAAQRGDSIRKGPISSVATPSLDAENAARTSASSEDDADGRRPDGESSEAEGGEGTRKTSAEAAALRGRDRDPEDQTGPEGGRLAPGPSPDNDDAEREDAVGMETDEVGNGDPDNDAEEGFALLGAEKTRKKQKVSRVLPDWLAHPLLVEHDLQRHSIAVEEMEGLDARLVRSLVEDGIKKLFPVQLHVIPVILDSVKHGIYAGDAGYRPRDICVSAPTGSGKTLAFALPIVQALLGRVVPHIRALVVLPTRDLAQQVNKVFVSLCRGTDLRPALIGGLKKFAQEQRMLVPTLNGETQCDIVVATPGRLVDHINKTQGFTFKHLRFLVIDEADRMMEQISQDWMVQVERGVFGDDRPLPGPLTAGNCSRPTLPFQKLLFSATLSQNPEKLMQVNLFQPRLITSVVAGAGKKSRHGNREQAANDGSEERGEFVGKYTTPVGLSEFFVQCTPGEKPLAVLHLVRSLGLRRVLCFVNTVEATHRLFHLLRLAGSGLEVAEFSSGQTAGQRRQTLRQFKAGKTQLLVCSDAMARGMDVENAECVLSYDMPPYLKTYIHRVGRTARAGRKGRAFSLLQKYEVPKLLKMLKHAGKTNMRPHPMDLRQADDLVASYERALQKLPGILRMEKSY